VKIRKDINKTIKHEFVKLNEIEFINECLEVFIKNFEKLIISKKLLYEFGIKKIYYYENEYKFNVFDNSESENTKNGKMIKFDSDNDILTSKKDKYKVMGKKTTKVSYLEKRSSITSNSDYSDSEDLKSLKNKNKSTMSLSILNNDVSDIIFYDYGINLLKKMYNFEKLKIEDISNKEKLILKKIIVSLHEKKDSENTGNIIYQMITSNSENLKEYLRNIELFYEYMNRIGQENIPSMYAFKMIQILFKIREMIKFVTKKYFKEENKISKHVLHIKKEANPNVISCLL